MPTVIPDFLEFEYGYGKPPPSLLTQMGIYLGEVTDIVQTQKGGKPWVRYMVDLDSKGPETGVSKQNILAATVSSVFGNPADSLRYTLRVGSRVIVAFVTGDTRHGIILGGYPDSQFAVEEEADYGHSLDFEFNGINANINNSGELTLTFRGATDSSGNLTDEAVPEAEGTYLTIDKEGSITIATPESAQYIRLDHKNKKLDILADTEWTTTVNGKVQLDIQNDLIANCSDGGCSIGVSKNVTIKSQGVLVGAANEAWVKGTSYRRQEGQMNAKLAAGLASAATAASVAAGALTGASTALLVPVTGGVIAAPMIATAAVAMATVSSQLGTMSGALTAFEAQSFSYLSNKNYGD
jgi:hypothetical protein